VVRRQVGKHRYIDLQALGMNLKRKASTAAGAHQNPLVVPAAANEVGSIDFMLECIVVGPRVCTSTCSMTLTAQRAHREKNRHPAYLGAHRQGR